MDPGGALRGEDALAEAAAVLTFLDTNVLVYAVDDSAPEKREIAEHLLGTAPSSLVISTQVLNEFFWAVTRRLAMPILEEEAEDLVRELASLRVVGADARFVTSAIALGRRYQLAIWDALIVRAAQVAGCTRLLSEDMHGGGRYGGVTIENPFRGAVSAT